MTPNRPRLARAAASLLLSTVLAVPGICQPLATPVATALSGSTAARTKDPSLSTSNPASIGSIDSVALFVSFAPSNLGIDRYHEGALVVALPLDSSLGCALAVHGFGNGLYEEYTASGSVAWNVGEGVAIGLATSLHSLAIARYGSALSGSIDAGIIVRPSQDIRFGASAHNLTRSTIAGTDLPQRLTAGFAFDLDSGTTLSIDLAQELRRQVSVALGVSTIAIEGFTIRGGVGQAPTSISLGTGYDNGSIGIDYGAAYIDPLGVRQAVGIRLRW